MNQSINQISQSTGRKETKAWQRELSTSQLSLLLAFVNSMIDQVKLTDECNGRGVKVGVCQHSADQANRGCRVDSLAGRKGGRER
jgi:hypothetical protein